jgi:hypothetical protein
VTKIKNLHKRGNVFYARVAVPKELRSLREAAVATGRANPRELNLSLRTSERKAADRLLPTFMAGVLREFDAEVARLRSGGVRPLARPSAHDLAEVREEFFRDELDRDELERNLRKSHAEIEVMREQLRARLSNAMPKTPLELYLSPGVIELSAAESAAEWSSERRGYPRPISTGRRDRH